MREQEIPHDEAHSAHPGARPGRARVPVSGREARAGRGARPGLRLGAGEPAELFPLVVTARRRAAPGRRGRQAPSTPRRSWRKLRRMLRDPKARRLATEFACQWLHIADFDHLDEKSERHFPTFAGLRGAMYEESIRFFTDLFQNDGSVLDILDADYTFLNEPLAKHYGIPFAPSSPAARIRSGWRRVDGIKKHGRGGILGQATTLAKQSGASRTSPILRGNWISEVLLGERLPRPPKGVPLLPEDEAATDGLTVRQLVEKHSSDPKCAVCHQRIDPFGFSLEGFDAIGRRREKDLGGPADRHPREDHGRDAVRWSRRPADVSPDDDARRLLAAVLPQAARLCPGPIRATFRRTAAGGDAIRSERQERPRSPRLSRLIVRSRQFREIRGRETAYSD